MMMTNDDNDDHVNWNWCCDVMMLSNYEIDNKVNDCDVDDMLMTVCVSLSIFSVYFINWSRSVYFSSFVKTTTCKNQIDEFGIIMFNSKLNWIEIRLHVS